MELRTAVAISGTAHAGFLAWALVAGWLPPVDESEKLQVAAVSIVSSAEFDALVSREPAAEPTPQTLEAPEIAAPPDAPAPSEDSPPPQIAQPAPPAPMPPDTQPDTSQITPLPRAEVVPDVPDAPSQPAEAPDLPESDRPAPRAAPRVADTPAPAPPPAAEVAPTVEAPPAPSAEPEEPVEPAEEPAAPEEAAPIIVTEADTPSSAPERSIRPSRRPERQVAAVQTTEPTEEPEEPSAPPAAAAEEEAPAEEPAEDALAGAIAEAVAEATEAPSSAPTGPPLTQGERDGLRLAVSSCWNLGGLSTEAMRTTVTIALEMNRDGTPLTNSIRLIAFDGGSEAAARQAFEAGRRAIIRCARDGYDLPDEKFEQWREIEMTFNPDQMRLR